jgi:putative transposase
LFFKIIDIRKIEFILLKLRVNKRKSIPKLLEVTELPLEQVNKVVDNSSCSSTLLYHFVWQAKYRREIPTEIIDRTLIEVCLEIEKQYELQFLEIGAARNHVNFLLQSEPTLSPAKIVELLKAITTREIFQKYPEVKEQLWGAELWNDGYYVSTASKNTFESVISKYIRDQGLEKEYKSLYKEIRIKPFDILDA